MGQNSLKTSTDIEPLHVAIIMDGNGRWAKKRFLPRTAGHKKGADAVRRCIEAAVELGVTHLTLFGFSSENWKRPEEEVSTLMGLLRHYLANEVKRLHSEGVCIRFIGDRTRLSNDIVEAIEESEKLTEKNTTLYLTIALSYGGRAELLHATKEIAKKVKDGQLDPEAISEETISQSLYTVDTPDPDLLIRTSGEQRVSNFLLWQLAYTEFVFMDVLWPDFNKSHLEEALGELSGRDRRYGMISG
ncbi:undecaprenyl pyrophosphate synthase [Candidatus Terasakiella magnetica]|uniref:Isoprenyl transferase n=1 Tax=Candidatus Terasakiella magnetica TaxID=1867952 RepID=A0A1C3RCR5_9PROT|nr:isoprenyl transferase [Candidatus Terasakiella magnetica]SCA55024.1 undecaprenyl pyrophosphate synthase [Candidatus Terasakiella magnetica]